MRICAILVFSRSHAKSHENHPKKRKKGRIELFRDTSPYVKVQLGRTSAIFNVELGNNG